MGIGSYGGRLVASLHFYDGNRDVKNDIVWLTDTGWVSLLANGFIWRPGDTVDLSITGFGSPHLFLEHGDTLLAATSYTIGFLTHPDSVWKHLPRKQHRVAEGWPIEDVGTIRSLAIWQGSLLVANATPTIYSFDLGQWKWTDSLIAKRWYSPDTAPAEPNGYEVNYKMYVHRDRLYLCGGSWPGGLFSSGAWVWKPEVREWWHIPLLRQRGKKILTNGAQPMTALAFVGDTVYAASLDGAWKYPLDLVP